MKKNKGSANKTVVVAVLLLGVISYAGYQSYKGKMMALMMMNSAHETPVVTYKVVSSSLTEAADAIGSLEASESAILRAEVAGPIQSISFSEGQPVKKGTSLLEIDSRLLLQEQMQAKANYELAEVQLRRRTELRTAGATSAEIKDQAEATLSQSKAQYEQASIRIEKSKILAPFDGMIGFRNLSVGDYLKVGDEITRIVSVNPMKLQFSLPEKYFSELKEGLQIDFTVDSWPNEHFKGKLYAIDPNVDLSTRKVSAKALVENQDSRLRPGMFARIKVIFSVKNNVLMVPEEAIISDKNQNFVMKVINGKAKMAPISMGDRQNGQVEVKEGIAIGDIVITAGYTKVQEGGAVKPIESPEENKTGVLNSSSTNSASASASASAPAPAPAPASAPVSSPPSKSTTSSMSSEASPSMSAKVEALKSESVKVEPIKTEAAPLSVPQVTQPLFLRQNTGTMPSTTSDPKLELDPSVRASFPPDSSLSTPSTRQVSPERVRTDPSPRSDSGAKTKQPAMN